MRWKIKFIFFIFTLWFIFIIGKAFYYQVVNNSSSSIPILTKKQLSERGIIYDKNGEILAENKKVFRLYIDKNNFKNKTEEIELISEKLGIDTASLEAKLNKKGIWISIVKNIPIQKKEELEKTKIKGLVFEEELKRVYPEASLSAHILGFVGKNRSGDSVGYFGIEGYYNESLQGLSGVVKSERGGGGLPVLFGIQNIIEPEKGVDLYLTIEKGIQKIVKDRLKEGIKLYGAKLGCITVVDPKTLEILALSCLPDYDPNFYYKYPKKYFVNYAISNAYEPGSIFKPLIVAAALEEKSIKVNDKVDESGPIRIGDAEINTWDNRYEGKITITRVLERSSNVGMVRIGERLGKEKLWKYLVKYGFFEKTGIDLQGEANSIIKPKRQWYPVDYATVTFGQGIAVTPIQMVRAFSAIVNGGELLNPHVVYKIDDGTSQIIKKKVERRVISDETSKKIRYMLVKAVENGLVKWKRPAGYAIGGKTGTAQIPIKGHYDPKKTLASFIGFFPAENPKILIMVMLKEPEASPWGSETAAPIFFKLVKDIIVYYNILPE